LLLQQSLRLADAPPASSNRLEIAVQSAEGICKRWAVQGDGFAGNAPEAAAQRIDARACAVLLAAASEQLRSLQDGRRGHSPAGGCLACELDILLELLQHLALALAPASACSERSKLRLRLHGLCNRIMASAVSELERDGSSSAGAAAAAAPASTWEILLARCLPLAASLCGAMALPTAAVVTAETERPVVQTASVYGSGGSGAATTQSLRATSAAPLSGSRGSVAASRLPVGLRLRSASSNSAGEGATSEVRAAALSYLSPLGTPGGIVVANAETLDGTPDSAAPASFLGEEPLHMEEADATSRRGTEGAASVLSSADCYSPAAAEDKLNAADSGVALVTSHRALVAATRGLACEALRACLRAAIARLNMEATAPAAAGGSDSGSAGPVAPAGAYAAPPQQQGTGAYAGSAYAGAPSAAAPPEVPTPVALPPTQQPAPATAPVPHIRRPSVRAGLSLQERLRAALGGGISNISAGASPAAGASTPQAFTHAAGAATPSKQQQRQPHATPAASGAAAPSSPLLGPSAVIASGGRGGYDGVRTLAPVPALASAEVDSLLRIAVQSALVARAFVIDGPLPRPATTSCSGASADVRARQLQALCGCDCCAASRSDAAGAETPQCALLCLLDCLRLSLQLVGRAAAFTTAVLQQTGAPSLALAGAVAAQGVGVWLAQLLLHSLAPRLLAPGVQLAQVSDGASGAAGSGCGCMQRCGQDLQRLLGRVSAGEYRLHTLAGGDAAAAARLRMLEALLQSAALGCCLSLA
jgi:hypothetical protein